MALRWEQSAREKYGVAAEEEVEEVYEEALFA